MKPKSESYAIVMVGFWNRMIFEPKWVMNELFHSPEIEKLFPMMPIAPLIYRDSELALMISEQRIIVQAIKFDKSIDRAEKMAHDLLLALPKTPISAIGINFGFIESKPQDSLLKLFNFADDVDIATANWNVGNKKISKQLTKDDKMLNLSIGYDSHSQIQIDANFHYPVNSATDAVEKLENNASSLHEELINLLENVYILRMEENSDE